MKRRRRLLLAAAAAILALSGCSVASATTSSGISGTEWDPGNIISDAVFYNSSAFAGVSDVQAALDRIGASCTASTCLRTAQYTPAPLDTTYCQPWTGPTGPQSYASILYYLGKACGINPQVAIVMVQKESQGLVRAIPPAALTGFGCPDTGPGGGANCAADKSGVWSQTAGMYQSFARLHQDPSRVNYIEGQTHDIMWNVAESGCGSAPVLVVNRATASLYTYTPYQPNAASLAAYPGTGDTCSSYGNRNFFRFFQEWFGSTGGGRPTPGGGGADLNKSQDPSTFGWVHNGPMEPLTFQGHNFGQVAKGTAGLWNKLLFELVPQIPGGLNNNLGCYADRNNVNSPGRLSFHAYGLACDINYDRNPNGSNPASLSGQYVIPATAARAAAARWCMEWGGDWDFPDPMHFEVHCSPQQVAQLVGGSTVQ